MKNWVIRNKDASIERVELCGLDITGSRYINTVRFFDPNLDLDRFCESLEKTVQQYPVLSGKIVKDKGRLFIEPTASGVDVLVEEVDARCSAFGPQAFPPNVEGMFNKLLPVGADFKGEPLLNVKIRRYSDGYISLGLCRSHVLADGRAAGMLFEDWYKNYCGESVTPPDVSRQAFANLEMTGIATAKADNADARVPVVRPFPHPFQPHYCTVSLTNDEHALLAKRAGSMTDGPVSFNELLHAILFRAYARSCHEASESVTANFACDLRRLRELGLPRKYFGNAFLQRTVSMPNQEVANLSWPELARQLADLSTPDYATAARDVALTQREYLDGRYNDFGVLTNAAPTLMNGGLFINNVAHISAKDFGGMGLWVEWSMNPPMQIRMAMISERKGEIDVRMVLPEGKIEPFKTAWRRCVDELVA